VTGPRGPATAERRGFCADNGGGAAGSPAVPSFRQLKLATLGVVGELGYGQSMRAAVRGFLTARLDALWAGPAGRFLEGGHPVDLARLARGRAVLAAPDHQAWAERTPHRDRIGSGPI
jgi:hypothetical protein